MYVYVSEQWNIILRSNKKLSWFQNKYREYDTKYSLTDNLIFEDNQIKRYENSRQYENDINKFHLERELESTKRKNAELLQIANTKVKKEMELEAKWQEPDEYQRKLYLLKSMRW
jgi:hypothetical protein